MTQKELAYIEDAIGHEKNITSIIEENIKASETKNIIDFLNEELKIHKNTLEKLLNMLEVKAHEW